MYKLYNNIRMIPASTVREFITHLDSNDDIQLPICNIIIQTHANSEGQIEIKMYSDQKNKTEFETLDGCLIDSDKSIKIPDRLRYVFRWEDIPGIDDIRLIRFLRKNYNLNLMDTVRITKSEDLRTIDISTEDGTLSLNLNAEESRVILRIGNDIADTFLANRENGGLNIYIANCHHTCHIKGCNIGKNRRYLIKFREALGNHVRVTAPKHFYGLNFLPDYGAFEYMCYEFVLRRNAPFKNRDDAIEAFKENPSFKLINESAVSKKIWEDRLAGWQNKWIPDDITKSKKEEREAPLGIFIGQRQTIPVIQRFMVNDKEPFEWHIDYDDAKSVPKSKENRMRALENHLRNYHYFQPNYPWPKYEQMGYKTFEAFFNGHNWRIVGVNKIRRNNEEKYVLLFNGQRFEYTAVIPITDLTTGNLIFNYYPRIPLSPSPIPPGLQENNPIYFETV